MKKICTAFLLLALFSGCEQGESSKVKISDMVLTPPPGASVDRRIDKFAANSVSVAQVEKKVIKEGDLSFETGNVTETRKSIYGALTKLGGYISKETETTSTENNRKEYTLKTRIPAKNFDLFLNNVSATADLIDSKNISVRDVTAEYIDVTARLANKKKLEQRYLELLKKSDKIADVLQVENKLSEIRSDIESTQGQLNYLVKEIDYSSLDITFYTKPTVKDNGQTFGYKITEAITNGWIVLGGLFFGLIGLWPLWVILILLLLVSRRWRKNIRRKKSQV
jgi:hypothetical protein